VLRRNSQRPVGDEPKVVLRPFSVADLADVATWVAGIDPLTTAADWLADAIAESGSGTSDAGTLDASDGHQRHRFTLAITESDRVVGAVLLSIDSWIDRRGEIGFVVGESSRGRGIAQRAVELLVRQAFDEVGLHRLWAVCDPENAAAQAVLLRSGFVVEGRLVHDRRIDGVWLDSLILGRIAGS